MMLLGARPYTVKRAAAGTRVDGRMVPGAVTEYTYRLSIQPVGGTDRQNLPEGIRSAVTHKAYTADPIELNDVVVYDGCDHKVVQLESWPTWLVHSMVYLTRIGEG